jgi:type IX secretion system PorP/SprF family membrane protein
MMRIFLTGIVVLLFSSLASAQQAATYSQYMFNTLAINPAYAGSHDALSVTALGRFQNVGLSGAPNTQTFSAHSPLVNNRVGVGLLVVHDELSVIGQTGVHFSYAYRLPIKKDKSTLSFGLQGGVSMYNAQYSKLDLFNNPGNGTPDDIFIKDIRDSRPNIGAGIYYSTQTSYVGLSMPSMMNNIFERGKEFTTVYQNVPIILTGGHVFTLNRVLKLKPNFLFKMVDGQPVEFDINANMLFDEVLWFGLSYKSSKQVVMLTQFKINDQFQFGYSYTVSAGPIRTVELGSHEVMLNYRFWFNKKGVVSPRYF